MDSPSSLQALEAARDHLDALRRGVEKRGFAPIHVLVARRGIGPDTQTLEQFRRDRSAGSVMGQAAQQGADRVARLQRGLDRLVRQRSGARSPKGIEKGLQPVGHAQQQLQRMRGCKGCAFDLSQQQTGVAFDAVDTSKKRVEVVPRRRIVLQRQRVPFNSFQMVFALQDEQFERLGRHGTEQRDSRGLIFPQPDTHFAFVLDKNEDVLDSGLIAVGDQQDLPPEIALLGLQRGQRAAPGPHEP